MSLRSVAKQLGISPAYLSYMVNGKRPWRPDLKVQYEALVNTVNKDSDGVNRQEPVYYGAGGGIRTRGILLGKQTLYP